MRKTIAELMSVDFVTVTARMSLVRALALLVDSETTELCVVDDAGRLEGIVTDFDLLKSNLNGELTNRTVRSLISRAVTLLPADALIDHVVPLFRTGICSHAYVCRDGRLLGCLTRCDVLKHLAQQTFDAAISAIHSQHAAVKAERSAFIQPHEVVTPPTPQYLMASTTSILGALNVD